MKTRRYCTACACYDVKWGIPREAIKQYAGAHRKCDHPVWGRKLDNPRVPEWCGLKVKYSLKPENSFAFVPYQIGGSPPINDVRVVTHDYKDQPNGYP